MRKLSPVLYVEQIEPCLPFWERLGFTRTVEVPEGNALGFVILARDGVEIMYQSRASLAKDVPVLVAGGAAFAKSGVGLYIEVADLQQVLPQLKGAEVVVPVRKTSYSDGDFRARAGGHGRRIRSTHRVIR